MRKRMIMTNTILIIEDDKDIRTGVHALLGNEGYVVKEAADGYEGLALARNQSFSLVILDIMMPRLSGIAVCREIRTFSNVPIIFLTAKADESDKLIGLETGGDDYLVKPFSYVELLARVKALIRRNNQYNTDFPHVIDDTGSDEWASFGHIKINKKRNCVLRDENELVLTDIEYRILLLLVEHPHKVFSIQNIYESIWEDIFISACANTVMVHIRNLRKKIEDDPQNPAIVKTVWGRGYQLG
jgi:DNA-binding response OmpR family regulator